jgi:hypothetical protein
VTTPSTWTGVSSLLSGKSPSGSSNLLDRESSSPSPALTQTQSQVDQLVTDFTHHATDWKSLAAMTAGGVAYRLGRMGAVAAETGRWASVGIGLGAEVTAFEMTSRSLSDLTGEGTQNPHLWTWNGTGGIRQGLLASLITFGSLKSAGRLAQGENVVVQHLLQDTGMVLGHQASASFGITERPQGSLAEQFLHAEVTNLQLGAGMSLAHIVAPGIQGLERSLDLSLHSTDVGARFPRPGEETSPLRNGLQPAMAMAGDAPKKGGLPTLLNVFSLGGKGEEPTLPEAVNPFEAKKPENSPWVNRSRQVPLENPSFPKKVIRAIQKSILRSNGDAFEHGVLAIQAGDALLVHEEDITSHHPKEVGGESYKKAILSLMARARLITADQRVKPVRIFMFHTHPRQDTHPDSFIQTPIYQHEDGEAFTHINGQDIKAAESILKILAPYLREYNYTGPIEIVAGAVPARTGLVSRNPYIAAYTRRIEAGEDVSESAPPKVKGPSPQEDNIRVRIFPHLSDPETDDGPNLYTATVVENLPPDPNSPQRVRITFVGNPAKDRTRQVYAFTFHAEEAFRAGIVTMESDLARLKYDYLKFELRVPEENPPTPYQGSQTPGKFEIDHPIFINEWCWNISSQRFVHIRAQLDPSIYDFKKEARPEGSVTVVTGPNNFHIEISDKFIKVFPF